MPDEQQQTGDATQEQAPQQEQEQPQAQQEQPQDRIGVDARMASFKPNPNLSALENAEARLAHGRGQEQTGDQTGDDEAPDQVTQLLAIVAQKDHDLAQAQQELAAAKQQPQPQQQEQQEQQEELPAYDYKAKFGELQAAIAEGEGAKATDALQDILLAQERQFTHVILQREQELEARLGDITNRQSTHQRIAMRNPVIDKGAPEFDATISDMFIGAASQYHNNGMSVPDAFHQAETVFKEKGLFGDPAKTTVQQPQQPQSPIQQLLNRPARARDVQRPSGGVRTTQTPGSDATEDILSLSDEEFGAMWDNGKLDQIRGDGI